MPDSQPNYLTTDADGRIGANFSGHISAAGVDLDAADDITPAEDNKVRWIRQADGSVVAELYGYHDETPGDDSRAFNSVVTAFANEFANNALTAQDDNGRSASITAHVNDATNVQRVVAFASGALGVAPTVIDGNGNSSYISTLTRTPKRIELDWDAGAGLVRIYVNGALVKSL